MPSPLRPWCLAAALLAAAAPARANGRFPAAQHVVVGPGATQQTVVLRTTFGLAVSDDAGRNFHWVCEDALQYAGPPFDPPLALDATGRVFSGIYDGLIRTGTDRCTFRREPAVEGEYIADVDHSRDGRTIVAVSSSGRDGARNRVYRSDDGGESFRPLGDGIAGVLFETLEMAPGDTSRVYLTGVRVSPRRVVMYRSDDGGATLTELPFAPGDAVDGAYVAGVDPTQRDTVFVRAVLPTPLSDAGTVLPSNSVLLRSTDGAQTFREVTRTQGGMHGFALSDDGRTVWVGGAEEHDGLSRSDDGGDTWRRISDVPVLCLRQHAGALYVCANYVYTGYALGRSMDRGDSITPLLAFAGLQPPFACPASSPENNLCGARWPVIHSLFVTPTDAGTDAAIDAPSVAEPSPPRTTCGCRVPSRGQSARAWVVLALGCGVVAGRRRRRT